MGNPKDIQKDLISIGFKSTPAVRRSLREIAKTEGLTSHEILERFLKIYEGHDDYNREEMFHLLFPASKKRTEREAEEQKVKDIFNLDKRDIAAESKKEHKERRKEFEERRRKRMEQENEEDDTDPLFG